MNVDNLEDSLDSFLKHITGKFKCNDKLLLQLAKWFPRMFQFFREIYFQVIIY